ncbi:MAG: hypothetical protein EPN93_17045 [Spirochaetes bacterium]|nr:MAG: hypothetical protein EPN93_17045 [Spirochaetota bacterium]
MIYDWNFAERIACTDDERRECARLIPRLMNMGLKARREGLLALEDDLEDAGHPFLRMGLDLVVNGTDPEAVRKALEMQILSQGYRGRELLERGILLEGLLMVQSGTIPRSMKDLLAVFFAESYRGAIDSLCEEEYEGTTSKILARLEGRPPVSDDTALLERAIADLSNEDIMKTLHEIDTHALIVALSGASGTVISRMCACLTPRAKDLLIEDLISFLHFPPDISDIISAQEKVLTALENLEDDGEMANPPPRSS